MLTITLACLYKIYQEVSLITTTSGDTMRTSCTESDVSGDGERLCGARGASSWSRAVVSQGILWGGGVAKGASNDHSDVGRAGVHDYQRIVLEDEATRRRCAAR